MNVQQIEHKFKTYNIISEIYKRYMPLCSFTCAQRIKKKRKKKDLGVWGG